MAERSNRSKQRGFEQKLAKEAKRGYGAAHEWETFFGSGDCPTEAGYRDGPASITEHLFMQAENLSRHRSPSSVPTVWPSNAKATAFWGWCK